MLKLVTQAQTNNSEGVRYVTLNQRDFLVAPVTAVIAGVLNGQLLPPIEIAHFPQKWNGKIVVDGHPQTDDGFAISANAPDVFGARGCGFFFNAHTEDDALKGEFWLDVALLKGTANGAAILERLQSGHVIEVSTAYFCNVSDEHGEYEGTPYRGVQTALIPDHVAILANEIGACSVDRGCGVGHTQNKQTGGTMEDEMTLVTHADNEADEGAGETQAAQGTTQEVVPSAFEEFAAGFGGIDALRALLESFRANAQAERENLIVKANKVTGIAACDLQKLPTDALRKLAAVSQARNADYSGAQGAVSNATVTVRPYKMPEVL